MEALGSKVTHEIQGSLCNRKNPREWNQQRFQTTVLVIYNERRTAGGLGEMKKRNLGLGCPVLSREAQRMMNDISIREADGRHLLPSGLCICCSLSLECPFLAFSGSDSLSLSLGFSFSRKTSLAYYSSPPHPSWAKGSHTTQCLLRCLFAKTGSLLVLTVFCSCCVSSP